MVLQVAQGHSSSRSSAQMFPMPLDASAPCSSQQMIAFTLCNPHLKAADGLCTGCDACCMLLPMQCCSLQRMFSVRAAAAHHGVAGGKAQLVCQLPHAQRLHAGHTHVRQPRRLLGAACQWIILSAAASTWQPQSKEQTNRSLRVCPACACSSAATWQPSQTSIKRGARYLPNLVVMRSPGAVAMEMSGTTIKLPVNSTWSATPTLLGQFSWSL